MALISGRKKTKRTSEHLAATTSRKVFDRDQPAVQFGELVRPAICRSFFGIHGRGQYFFGRVQGGENVEMFIGIHNGERRLCCVGDTQREGVGAQYSHLDLGFSRRRFPCPTTIQGSDNIMG